MPARDRSPNYPALPLGDALQLAKALYQRERRSVVDPYVAIQAWGHESLSGRARTKLAALRHYGLLEQDERGVKVSDRGYTLVALSPATPEYRSAIRAAALEPDLFRELQETHLQASDENLKYHLVLNKKFTPDGAAQAVESFRGTMAVAGLSEGSYDGEVAIQQEAFEEAPVVHQASAQLSASAQMHAAAEVHHPEVHRWQLPNDVMAEVRFIGGEVTPRHVKMLRRYLNLLEESIQGFENEPEDLAEERDH